MKRLLFKLFIAFFLMVTVLCSAASSYDFSTEPIAEYKQREIWESLNFQTVEKVTDKALSRICSFDVSEQGEIAILLDTNQLVLVDHNGTVDSVYTYSCAGDSYVYWENDYIVLYLVRGDLLIKLESDGTFAEVANVAMEVENYHQFSELKSVKAAEMGGSVFQIKNETQLIRISAAGQTTTVFDLGDMSRVLMRMKTLFSVGTVLLGGASIGIIVLVSLRTSKRKKQRGE